MTQDIISKIEKSITDATGLPYYYDTPQTLNVRLDRAQMPCAMMQILSSGTVLDENGILRERLTVEMIFANVCQLDFDGKDAEKNVIHPLKVQAFKWLLFLYRSHDLRIVSVNNTQRYYATDDVIFGGFGVNVTLDEIAGISKCDILS